MCCVIRKCIPDTKWDEMLFFFLDFISKWKNWINENFIRIDCIFLSPGTLACVYASKYNITLLCVCMCVCFCHMQFVSWEICSSFIVCFSQLVLLYLLKKMCNLVWNKKRNGTFMCVYMPFNLIYLYFFFFCTHIIWKWTLSC